MNGTPKVPPRAHVQTGQMDARTAHHTLITAWGFSATSAARALQRTAAEPGHGVRYGNLTLTCAAHARRWDLSYSWQG